MDYTGSMTGPTPNGRLLDAARHLGTRNDSVAGRRKMQVYFIDEVKTALKDGASVVVQDGEGKDAMDWLSQLQDRPHAGAATVAKLLIDHSYPILDTPALHKLQGPLLEQVAAHLARKERNGKGIRSRQGGTFLHAACQDLSLMSRLSVAREFSLRALIGLAPMWINAVDDHGQTPMHVFWAREREPMSLMHAQWQLLLSATLKDCGADWMIQDRAGKTALDCIAQALDGGWVADNDPGLGQAERLFLMQVQHARLDLGTTGTDSRRRGPRL